MQAVFLLPTCCKFYLYLNLVSSLPHITDSVQSLQNTNPQSDGLLKGAMQKSGEDSLGGRYMTTFVRLFSEEPFFPHICIFLLSRKVRRGARLEHTFLWQFWIRDLFVGLLEFAIIYATPKLPD